MLLYLIYNPVALPYATVWHAHKSSVFCLILKTHKSDDDHNDNERILLCTFISTIVEHIERLHCSWSPLLVAKNQIYPFMKMSRNILRFLEGKNAPLRIRKILLPS